DPFNTRKRERNLWSLLMVYQSMPVRVPFNGENALLTCLLLIDLTRRKKGKIVNEMAMMMMGKVSGVNS
ncbi:MAG: hypothetical protein OEW87_09290, partial [Flavobacteriaceae bacterium]|nr:hypothetical protein [Flavobacteriaceae bacterium]